MRLSDPKTQETGPDPAGSPARHPPSTWRRGPPTRPGNGSPSPDVAVRRHPVECDATPAIGGGHDPPARADPEADRRARRRSGGHPATRRDGGSQTRSRTSRGGRRVNFGALHSEEDADGEGGPSRDSRRPGTAAGPTLVDSRRRRSATVGRYGQVAPASGRESGRIGSSRVLTRLVFLSQTEGRGYVAEFGSGPVGKSGG